MSIFLNHDEATEAFSQGKVVKIASTIMVMSKNKIKMRNSDYIVDNRMPTVRHKDYEIVSESEYEVISNNV